MGSSTFKMQRLSTMLRLTGAAAGAAAGGNNSITIVGATTKERENMSARLQSILADAMVDFLLGPPLAQRVLGELMVMKLMREVSTCGTSRQSSCRRSRRWPCWWSRCRSRWRSRHTGGLDFSAAGDLDVALTRGLDVHHAGVRDDRSGWRTRRAGGLDAALA